MANGTKELNTSPITIEDEINEFSEKPVQGKTLYKKLKELEDGAVPDASEASVGDVLTKGEDGIGWSAPSGGGSGVFIVNATETPDTFHLILDKKWSEIKAASDNGQIIRITQNINNTYFNFHIVTGFVAETNNYLIYSVGASGSGAYGLIYSASSANDYPQAEID